MKNMKTCIICHTTKAIRKFVRIPAGNVTDKTKDRDLDSCQRCNFNVPEFKYRTRESFCLHVWERGHDFARVLRRAAICGIILPESEDKPILNAK